MNPLIRETAEQEVQLDMTPMIDCVFLMIIFFICIDFRALEVKLEAYLPRDLGARSTLAEPEEKLHVRIVCTEPGSKEPRRQLTRTEAEASVLVAHVLRGHKIQWQVNTAEIQTAEALLARLEQIAADAARRPRDPKTGEPGVLRVEIEPGPGTCWDDVATTADVVRKAGFADITFSLR